VILLQIGNLSTSVPSRIGQRLNAANCLVEAVDEALEMAGVQIPSLVYGYLETRYQLPRDQIASRPGVFLNGLSSLFGGASKSLEENIVKRFYEKMGIKAKSSESLSLRTMYLQLQNKSESAPHVRWI
jgi:hypothetical protein